MKDNPPVNRYLSDKAMDQIDHAPGRPVWPMRETYRNHYATCVGGEVARAFDASPHWEQVGVRGTMAYYSVTKAGMKALKDHLEALPSGDRRRAFVVTFEGYPRIVAARSRAHARYSEWLSISDSLCELTFGEFLKNSTVRAAP